MKIRHRLGVVVLSAAGLVMIAPTTTNAALHDVLVLETSAAKESIEGTIERVDTDDNAFILRTEEGKRIKLSVDADTRFTLNGEPSSMVEALKPGAAARVTHEDRNAVRVDVTADVTPG
jgi:hypothetical protein